MLFDSIPLKNLPASEASYWLCANIVDLKNRVLNLPVPNPNHKKNPLSRITEDPDSKKERYLIRPDKDPENCLMKSLRSKQVDRDP
jgi:hypothetical protein